MTPSAYAPYDTSGLSKFVCRQKRQRRAMPGVVVTCNIVARNQSRCATPACSSSSDVARLSRPARAGAFVETNDALPRISTSWTPRLLKLAWTCAQDELNQCLVRVETIRCFIRDGFSDASGHAPHAPHARQRRGRWLESCGCLVRRWCVRGVASFMAGQGPSYWLWHGGVWASALRLSTSASRLWAWALGLWAPAMKLLSSGVEALSSNVEALHSGVDALISDVGALISERQEFCAPASRP